MTKHRREIIIKFQALCVCVKHDDLFLSDLEKLCKKYSRSGGRNKPLMVYTKEEGQLIRPLEKK